LEDIDGVSADVLEHDEAIVKGCVFERVHEVIWGLSGSFSKKIPKVIRKMDA